MAWHGAGAGAVCEELGGGKGEGRCAHLIVPWGEGSRDKEDGWCPGRVEVGSIARTRFSLFLLGIGKRGRAAASVYVF